MVRGRMSQSKGVKGINEKKKVTGWSIEEMREKQNINFGRRHGRNE